jgi:Tfp pilus assembly protein PilE
MGCLVVVVLSAVTGASIRFLGYPPPLLVALGLLWLAGLVLTYFNGHHGFGNRGNTDLMIVIAGFAIALMIAVPDMAARQPRHKVRAALEKVAKAERDYFERHRSYTADPAALGMPDGPDFFVTTFSPNPLAIIQMKTIPEVHVMLLHADAQSFSAAAIHRLVNDNTGGPVVFYWDSARGGMQ